MVQRQAFVTGGTGFVGRHLVRALLRAGFQVRALSRQHQPALAGVEWVHGELADETRLRRLIPERVDALFHLAANIDFSAPRARMLADNVEGTAHLLAAARARSARRFVFTSTAGVWGLTHHHFDESTPFRDDDIAYLQSKRAAERLVRDAVANGLDALILNPGHILGPEGAWSALFARLRARKVPLVPPGAASWCHVDALVEAQTAALERGTAGRNYLLGCADASYAELTALAAKRLAVPAPRVAPALFLKALAWSGMQPDLPRDLASIMCARLVYSSARAREELGYRARSLAEMVESSLPG